MIIVPHFEAQQALLMPGIHDFQKMIMHEGNNTEFINKDGVINKMRPRKFQAEISILNKDILNLTPQDILNKYSEVAKILAEDRVKYVVLPIKDKQLLR